MKIMELIKRIIGKTDAESRRQKNWNFPIKEFVLANSVYTTPPEMASEPPALVWVSLDEEVRHDAI